MLRSGLQEICLNVNNQAPNSRVEEFLARAIGPSWPEAMQVFIEDLKDLEAFTPDGRLAPLGRLLASLLVYSPLGKMIVLGIRFRCLNQMLILYAAADANLFLSFAGNEKVADMSRNEFGKGYNSNSIDVVEVFRYARRCSLIPSIKFPTCIAFFLVEAGFIPGTRQNPASAIN
ncbi:hypothetical protein BDZ45DRAFT_740797 [Acephala macrosclerotiorum]|nr:hypothetical protein BDZ45DRAFT_740797 [Acephala macrosclerotiorum]